jgi:hypothetical protein
MRPPPKWSTPGEAFRLWFARGTLRRTVTIAAIVGTLLSAINQGSVIAGGNATVATWIRVGMNYVVPFCVSSVGFLSATRAARPERATDPG